MVKFRHLDITQGRYKHLTELRARMLKATRDWFYINKYLEVPCPHITGATGSCEYFPNAMALTMYQDNGDKHNMFLRQTSQLYLEAFIPTHKKVFSIGSSFRQERKVTNRHLCEFTLIEFETEDLEGLSGLMDSIESLVKVMYTAGNIYGDEDVLSGYVNNPFKRITYRQALNALNEHSGYSLAFGYDFKNEHESWLCEYYEGPTFITLFPPSLDSDNPEKVIKFFSMKRNLKNGYTLCADLLLPKSGESVGAAIREGDPKVCKEQLQESIMLKHMKEMGIDESDFDWYFEVLSSTPPEYNSAGCGLGFERIVQSILGTLTDGEVSIKNAIEIPRSPEYLYM